jgi:hypothetical protein
LNEGVIGAAAGIMEFMVMAGGFMPTFLPMAIMFVWATSAGVGAGPAVNGSNVTETAGATGATAAIEDANGSNVCADGAGATDAADIPKESKLFDTGSLAAAGAEEAKGSSTNPPIKSTSPVPKKSGSDATLVVALGDLKFTFNLPAGIEVEATALLEDIDLFLELKESLGSSLKSSYPGSSDAGGASSP